MTGVSSLEPQTRGLVVFNTTFGDLEIELFTQQCPKATRNFVQLCLDKYYNGTIFSRVEKDFIAIGGVLKDAEADEESQERFKDEFHPRLRFSRRGLMATANTDKDANGPRFFFTLGPTPELQNKHTIFGRLKGDSVYRLVDLNECQVGDDLVPLSEKEIIDTIVVANPYPDLGAKKEYIRVRHIKQSLKQEDDTCNQINRPRLNPYQAKKLSFHQSSDDDDEDSEILSNNEIVNNLEGEKSTPSEKNDLNTSSDISSSRLSDKYKDEKKSDLESKPVKFEIEDDAREKRLREIRKQIQELKQQIENNPNRPKLSERRQLREQGEFGAKQLDKSNSPGDNDSGRVVNESVPHKGRRREKETLELVHNFRKKLKKQSSISNNETKHCDKSTPNGRELNINEDKIDTESSSLLADLDKVDDDAWLQHKFVAADDDPQLAKDANTKDDNWYSIDDPRNPMNKRMESDLAQNHRRSYGDRRHNHHSDRRSRETDRGSSRSTHSSHSRDHKRIHRSSHELSSKKRSD